MGKMREPRTSGNNEIDRHHSIGFDTIEKLEWHLKNLWSGGFSTLKETCAREHEKKTGLENRRQYWKEVRGLKKLPAKSLAGSYFGYRDDGSIYMKSIYFGKGKRT